MNVHSAAFSIADDTLSISKPCSLATSARAIQRVTGPNALRFRCARLRDLIIWQAGLGCD